MRTKYIDLIQQTFDFPQKGFALDKGNLLFHEIPLLSLAKKYGTPLKFTYLPKISQNIANVKRWFSEAYRKHQYPNPLYSYCYCTKSSHFKFVLDEVLKNDVYLETSSSFDLDIVNQLSINKTISKQCYIICNGYKQPEYLKKIAHLISQGQKCWPIIDNIDELSALQQHIKQPFEVGIRIASEEEPKFEFYTSRLGIGYKDILPLYRAKIKENKQIKLKILHFFVNTGIFDNVYYWNELQKCLKIYVALRKECDTLDCLNIGGGFPTQNSLNFNYDYTYMIDEIVGHIKAVCNESNVPAPHIFTEFGSYTVGESGGAIFKVISQKQQNDREKWCLIDASFMTALPDTWAINKRFLMLPINKWHDTYERVLLGGLSCDSDDYYNSEQNKNAIYLPVFQKEDPLYIGFLHTGAYQETIGGFGGLQHCLIPHPKYLLIDKNTQGEVTSRIFSEEQTAPQMLQILGYKNN